MVMSSVTAAGSVALERGWGAAHQSLRLAQPFGNLAGTGRSSTECPGHVPRGPKRQVSDQQANQT